MVHPQFWPEDLDYSGKRVVVIGSGATAISLIPALAEKAAHVTMLQRSPTYMMSMPRIDPMVELHPESAAAQAYPTRWCGSATRCSTCRPTSCSAQAPRFGRKLIRSRTIAALPEGYAVDVHFKPKYDPWDQRMCLILDDDLFEQIRRGRAEVVTDNIDHVDETGIVLTSGARVDADVIVTATGLQLQALGGIRIFIDGNEIKPTDRFVYKEYLLEDVPNMAWCIGYTNASWTLRADMTAKAVAKLLAYMDARGYTHAYPHLATRRSPRSRPSICRPATSSGRRTRCRSRALTGRGTCGTTTCSTSSTTGSTGSKSRWCSAARRCGSPAPPESPHPAGIAFHAYRTRTFARGMQFRRGGATGRR